MHMVRRVAVTSLALLTILLGACSASGPAGSPATGAQAGASTGTSQAVSPAAAGGGSSTLGDPVQLTVDPCNLVTRDEAAKVLGVPVSPVKVDVGGGGCNYVGVGSPSHLMASTPSAASCRLLYLALDKNIFGGVQQRVDDIGDGGMLVTGEGNVQIAVHHGCIEIDAANGANGDTALPDATMLNLARTAVARVP